MLGGFESPVLNLQANDINVANVSRCVMIVAIQFFNTVAQFWIYMCQTYLLNI